MKKAILLRTRDGDWEGLYINGVLIDQGHRMGEGSPEDFWLDISAEYSINSSHLIIKELTEEDDAKCNDSGVLPTHISHLQGNY